jgi:prepilin-type N-terminal cleavage/methylation domain-containing protein
MSRARAQAGFTFFETMVVVAVGGVLYLLLGESLSTSSKLSSTTRAELQVNDDVRRSLDAIAGILRGASWETLDGFNQQDVAVTPSFQRVIGSSAQGYVLDSVESLSWRSARSADGIDYAGEVVHVKDGETTVVAPRVPGGGFRVERTGTTLKIVLTTYASTSQRVVTQRTSETLVALRN